jgi:hypothetical protein
MVGFATDRPIPTRYRIHSTLARRNLRNSRFLRDSVRGSPVNYALSTGFMLSARRHIGGWFDYYADIGLHTWLIAP